ncbi:MAG: metallophosphatase family protein [Coriobacteriia bacterium]|nr:metallophosphatase family protein [Coriobacteriia bacterium]
MPAQGPLCRIGLISDTHGFLDPRVMAAFRGVDRILHAGDIGRPHVLWELQALAPTDAVLGNTDSAICVGEDLPLMRHLPICGVDIVLVHDQRNASAALQAVGAADAVVFGHSHRAVVAHDDGLLWINPGSATRPRGNEPRESVAVLELAEDAEPTARILFLDEFS